MIARAHLSRRRFLLTTGIIVGAGAVGYSFSSLFLGSPKTAIRKLALEVYPSHEDAALGQEYLRLVPGENDEEMLLSEVLSAIGDRGISQVELRGSFKERVKADFANREITIIQGWEISRTEARLAALSWVAHGRVKTPQ